MRKVIGSSPISSTKPLVKTSGFFLFIALFLKEPAPKENTSFRGAERRGNLLEHCSNPHCLPGDCHGPTGLAMTWYFLPGPSFDGAVRTPREGCPYRDPRRERRPRRSAVRTKITAVPRRIRTISPPVIPRGEAPWESPGTRCSYQRSARRLPRPYGPRNDVVFFTRSFFWWCGPDTPGGVSLR